MDLRIITRDQLDKNRWNGCIHYAANGNVFGYAWYLDQVSKEWRAIVEGDYESVLPLVWKKHWTGRKKLYQPTFVRELGIFSIRVLSRKRIERFLRFIPDEFKLGEIPLNERNVSLPTDSFELKRMTNHQIMLDQPYEVLRSSYSPELIRHLRMAAQAKLIVTTSIQPEQIAAFYRRYSDPRKFREHDFHALLRIMYNSLHRGWGHGTGIFDQQKNLLACNFFIYSHHKVLSLVPISAPTGLGSRAFAYLMDIFIRNHANRKLILDLNSPAGLSMTKEFGGLANHYYHFMITPTTLLNRLIYR